MQHSVNDTTQLLQLTMGGPSDYLYIKHISSCKIWSFYAVFLVSRYAPHCSTTGIGVDANPANPARPAKPAKPAKPAEPTTCL